MRAFSSLPNVPRKQIPYPNGCVFLLPFPPHMRCTEVKKAKRQFASVRRIPLSLFAKKEKRSHSLGFGSTETTIPGLD